VRASRGMGAIDKRKRPAAAPKIEQSVMPKGNKRLVDGVKHSLKSRGNK
jgi:hypothetical protein